MRPNSPRTELKISITKILTNLDTKLASHHHLDHAPRAYSEGSAASAKAAPLPLIPTATPQIRLHNPTVSPDQNSAKPV